MDEKVLVAARGCMDTLVAEVERVSEWFGLNPRDVMDQVVRCVIDGEYVEPETTGRGR